MRVEVPKREAERRRIALAAGLELRVNPNRTDGQGGYFSPPLWLIDHFAGAPRVERTLSALIPNLPLPRGVSEVKLPRMTTGTHVFPIADGAAVPSRDIVDAAPRSPSRPSRASPTSRSNSWSSHRAARTSTGRSSRI
jgi:hypothetical protein